MRLVAAALVWALASFVPPAFGVPAGSLEPVANATQAQAGAPSGRPAGLGAESAPGSAAAVIDNASAALDALAALPADGIRAFLSDGGPALLGTLSTPAAITEVASWWNTLQAGERARLERSASPLVGNLDGVPFSVRAAVNESRLRSRTDAVERLASRAFGPAALAAASDLATLHAISDALRTPAAAPTRSLITFETSGPTLAAIAIGDLDRATDVSILVPGMLYSVQGQMVDWTGVAADLYQAQVTALQRLGASGRSVATVAWLGYRTPDLLGALSLEYARQGADRLQSVLSGLRAVRTDNEPFVSVIAHSYGSTTALLALRRGEVSVDALALLGSPGADVSNVSALHVSGSNVYVGAARFDPVATSGYFGSNPDAPGFGAHRMSLGGGVDPLDGRRMLPAVGHNGYFQADGESMRNLALIGIGQGSFVAAQEGPAS